MEKFAKQNSLKIFRISALNNIGVKDLFESITKDIFNITDNETLNMRSESIKLGYINGGFFNKDGGNRNIDNTGGGYLSSSCCLK